MNDLQKSDCCEVAMSAANENEGSMFMCSLCAVASRRFRSYARAADGENQPGRNYSRDAFPRSLATSRASQARQCHK